MRHVDGGDWRMWERAPAKPLAGGIVETYEGYWERRATPLRRTELPYGGVTLILSFGDPIAVTPAAHSTAGPATTGPSATAASAASEASASAGPTPQPHNSFVAGLFDAPVITEHDGAQHGMEIRLTPAGAHAAFGVPPGAYANRVVRWDDLAPRPLAGLAARLAEAPTWTARFALADRVLCDLVADAPPPTPEVAHAVDLLTRTEGRTTVAELARETGWSRRRLAGRFREHVGMPPKVYARVLRFQHALRLLEAKAAQAAQDPQGAQATRDVQAIRDTRGGGLSALAQACGYYDQAHLNRDFRALAGCSPTVYLAGRHPPGAFPFVQYGALAAS
ncbi:helix-turn-helix domain-containing protein [Streptomyces iconiensis]|uniref:Helix-turn-helix domain-containing protein n=1 Tax=Streptomyces iconiensis TaxID=1384038 RepID=A0ABT7AAG4_9ACTN|nr:helix-turn-helix domain-containing protein [Streptomyces iconiensis]MDJ1138335.1 helix-turn-helix domain-containing protein [Streptomyces iconiensis]